MAYKKAELEQLALKAIEEHGLMFVEDVVCFLPCTRKTFYNWNLHKLHTIKEAMVDVKAVTKSKLRSKWMGEMASATTQIVLYKLLANETELKAINGESNVVVNNVESKRPLNITFTKPREDA